MGDFRLSRAKLTPNFPAIGTVRFVRSVDSTKGNTKLFVHMDAHSEALVWRTGVVILAESLPDQS